MNTSATHDAKERRTLTGLFAELWREASALMRAETELAKTELGEKISQVGNATTALAVGAVVVFAGFLVLLSAAVGAVGLFVPPQYAIWLAPLIVGLAVVLIGLIAMRSARRQLKAERLAPSRTIESLRRDGRLFKEHLP